MAAQCRGVIPWASWVNSAFIICTSEMMAIIGKERKRVHVLWYLIRLPNFDDKYYRKRNHLNLFLSVYSSVTNLLIYCTSCGWTANISWTMLIEPWEHARWTGVERSCCWAEMSAPFFRHSSTASMTVMQNSVNYTTWTIVTVNKIN